MLIVTCAGDKIKAANIECKTVCPTSRIDTLNCHDAGAYLVASHTAGMVYPPCAAAAELRLEGWTSDPKPPLPPTNPIHTLPPQMRHNSARSLFDVPHLRL